VRVLFIRLGAEKTPEGRSLRLLRQWLSAAQRARLAENGYFELVGCDIGKQYRIHPDAMSNVCKIELEVGRVVARRAVSASQAATIGFPPVPSGSMHLELAIS
jgi:hypothetical protein